MKKRLVIILSIILLLAAGFYLYLRFHVLKTKDFKPDTAKQKNVIDLRPSIIAKLQQLVKDGSNGLYVLTIDGLDPDVLASTVTITNASIKIDTAAMMHLDKLHLLPDDIFSFHFTALHIDGIGINDLLNKDRIDVKNISVTNLVINVYHKKQSYNEAERERKEKMSLYEKLKGNMKKIAIGKININNGTIINHDVAKKKVTKYKDVSIIVNDLLIDSTTRNDNSRFLFAKRVTLNTKNYSIATPDSLYYFKIGDISISGDQHRITALNVELKPRLSRQQFESKLSVATDMYNLVLPKIILKDVDWQALLNNEKFIVNEAEISGGTFTDFLDRSKPSGPLQINNYPHQLLMKLAFPISIKKSIIRHLNFTYEEHNPLTDKNCIIYFDNVDAEINNISNIPSEIKTKKILLFSGKALLMHNVPLSVKFKFDLLKTATGQFVADINIDSINNTTINPVAEPLGSFSIKSGIMQNVVAHVEGNNFNTKGDIVMRYSKLNITPLKKSEDGTLKKKRVTGILANTIFIKNENPKGNELRHPDFTVERGQHKNFFNFLWVSVLTGIAKTIGIPVKLVVK